MTNSEPILQVNDLKKHYPIKRGLLNREVGAAKAVDGISFEINPGETVGLVGESGCGKSTAATSIIRLEDPTDGEVIFNGGDRQGASRNGDGTHPNDVTRFNKRELKRFRREAQMIFQDPASSFNPRMSVGRAVSEMLEIHGMKDKHRRRAIVEDLLERVGLSAEDYDRYPHEFSGGQKQRIGLARALVLNPDLIIADEPVSALDVSIQAEVLSLIDDLQDEFGLSLLFISHDMGVIKSICDRVAVMYLGEIVEIGEVEELFRNPQHPYTEALMSAIPNPDPRDRSEGISLSGTVPSPTNPPSGCKFHTRCHKVVQSDEFDLEQEAWQQLLTFRQQVSIQGVDVDEIRENALLGRSEEEITDSVLKSEVRKEFDLPSELSDREAEKTLDNALDSIIADDFESATETLQSTFTTPCEEIEPEFTDHGDGHRSACIRHRNEIQSMELAADD
jgi:peptide/nickel transport system ATP-binding protein